MTHNFKPGEKARMAGDVINTAGVLFRKGEVVTVVENDQTSLPYQAINKDGVATWLKADQLEPLPSGQFYVGQDVWDKWLYPGVMGKAYSLHPNDESYYALCVDFGGNTVCYTADGCCIEGAMQTLYPYDYDIQITPARFVPEANTPVNALDEGWWVAAIFINTTTDGRYLVRYGTRAYLVDRIEPYNPDMIGKTDNP